MGLRVCLQPHVVRENAALSLNQLFSDCVLPDGRRAFFHPDEVSFGEGVFVSCIVAAASGVPGVVHVEVTALCRRGAGQGDALETGVLSLAPLEIARFDNNPSRPEFGILQLKLEGGR